MIYVREAHPSDGWLTGDNKRLGVELTQPKTNAERGKVAQTCQTKLNISMPLLVDTIEDTVGTAYSAMPERLYVIDPQGKVAYKSGRGPFGFTPEECEQSLILLLTKKQPKPASKAKKAVSPKVGQASPPDHSARRLTALTNAGA